ncbi:MAG: MerR family transcriptional regulator [Gemmobacter sp.]|jgi:DNA-binding transcriptional MerR regulator|nr:MerR family transcriptional regulator [Gemmobacter sp.]
MDKSPDAFRTISEVAETLETPTHVLRFWESRFPQIKPVKRAGGRRYYRPVDVALLSGIRRLLHDDGMTIRGVQKILREQGVRYVTALVGGAPEPDMAEQAPDNLTPLAQPPVGAEVIALRDRAPPVAAQIAPAETGIRAEAVNDATRSPQPPVGDPQQPSLFDQPPDTPETGRVKAAGQPSGAPAGDAGFVAGEASPTLVETDRVPDDAPSTPVEFDACGNKAASAPAATPAIPAEASGADSPRPAPCDPPWLPALLRALPRDQAAARVEALAAFLPRIQALHERLAQARHRSG